MMAAQKRYLRKVRKTPERDTGNTVANICKEMQEATKSSNKMI